MELKNKFTGSESAFLFFSLTNYNFLDGYITNLLVVFEMYLSPFP
jgi:hypothetical protein